MGEVQPFTPLVPLDGSVSNRIEVTVLSGQRDALRMPIDLFFLYNRKIMVLADVSLDPCRQWSLKLILLPVYLEQEPAHHKTNN